MSNFDHSIKTLKILSADVKSIVESSAKVIREVTLCINLHGKPLANIACAGNYLDELAIGFLKSERIITGLDEIEKIEVEAKKNSVNIILKNEKKSSEIFVKNIASSGARGKSVSVDLLLPLKVPVEFNIKTQVVLELMEELLEKSLLHNETHGTHCSALAQQGKIIALREDIGRHNTIDMLGGYVLQKINLSDAIILTTGRISSEIVYKVWNLGIPAIISRSAPTTKAIELLNKANIMLIGYVRGGRMNIYSQERRVKI
jgi:formate dehydrogenase family accessory protein FdhD